MGSQYARIRLCGVHGEGQRKRLLLHAHPSVRAEPNSTHALVYRLIEVVLLGLRSMMHSPLHITLLPVYSKLAAELPSSLQEALPSGWFLSQHQVDTYLALTDPNGPDVVINTAMTGDGKSLAGQLPAMLGGWQKPLLAMYPTNELIHDQASQIGSTWQRWNRTPVVASLDSSTLDQVLESQELSQRGDALLSMIRNYTVLLTNPDIFHYIMQTFYRRTGRHGDASDRLIGPLLDNFEQFTFDEFHLFDAPQTASVMNALLLITQLSGVHRKRFLFQSATPSKLLRSLLERAGLNFVEIGGEYASDLNETELEGWRRILYRTNLSFAEGTVENWLDTNLETVLLPFFLDHRPAAKGAIIVNSVAQAKRICQRLAAALQPHGLTVGENTALSSKALRRASYECDILVGTSTVDVGVDFRINFLLFESHDAGTFLQRLGRLGRHEGYRRGDQEISFKNNFQAYALLPRWTLEALFQGQSSAPAPLAVGMELPRTQFAAILQQAFPPPATFDGYARRWGVLQSVRVLKALSEAPVRQQYSGVRAQLAAQAQRVLRANIGAEHGRYKELVAEAPVLLDEVTAFRGGSYFICGVHDPSETTLTDQIKIYDLFWLVSNAALMPLSSAEFWQLVVQARLRKAPIERHRPIAFYRLAGFRAERLDFRLYLEHEIASWGAERCGVALPLSGITLDPEFARELPNPIALNKALARQTVPALICLGYAPLALKQRLRLPFLFKLYPFRSRDGLSGSLAIGREALLLDVAIHARRLECGGGSIIV